MGIKPPAQMACYCNGKNISMKFTESIYFLSAEFKIKLLSSCVQHKKTPKNLLQPSFYHLAEYLIHNKSQNMSI